MIKISKWVSAICAVIFTGALLTACGSIQGKNSASSSLAQSYLEADSAVSSSASSDTQQNSIDNSSLTKGVPENLGGITLGTDKEQVIKKWGRDYKEKEYLDDSERFSEAASQWTYGDGTSILIGNTSQKVLEIRLYSDTSKTALGVKVGDNAKDSLNLYRKYYSEAVSKHDESKLDGWFDVGNNMVLILDTDKDDGKLMDGKVLSESKVEAIYLLYQDSLD